jgi:hypothetical protein
MMGTQVLEKKKKKIPPLRTNIRIMDKGVDGDGLRRMAEKHPEQFMHRCEDLIASGELTWSRIHDLRGLYKSLYDVKVQTTMESAGEQRAIMASAFPLLTGLMTVAGFNAAYEDLPTIGQELVTELNDPKRVTLIAAVTPMDTEIDTVPEGKDYPEIGAGEKKFEIRSKRNGRILKVTAETIEENNVADIISKINILARIFSDLVEEQTLRRVCDVDGSGSSPAEYYTFRPDSTPTQLYNATANNPGTQAPSGTRVENNELADATNLDAVRTVLAAMTNERGKRISISVNQSILLVPDALVGAASHILNSEYTPDIINQVSNWGPKGQWRPRLLTSPRLDDLSTSTWYLGQFREQFTRKWKLEAEFVTLGENTQAYLQARIAIQMRIGWDVEIGSLDYVRVVQSLAATTPPS